MECPESEDGKHYWARRRDGRQCIFCEKREYGEQEEFRNERGVVLKEK